MKENGSSTEGPTRPSSARGSRIRYPVRNCASRRTSSKASREIHLSDEALRDIVLDEGQARRIFAKNPELFLQLAQQEDLTRNLFQARRGKARADRA
jgi:uncharacterized protein YjiS (DUF1127 family)